MSRKLLQAELLKDISDEDLLLNHKVVDFEVHNDNTVSVMIDSGKCIHGSMLVGADGIRSTIRKCLHEKYPLELGPEPKIIFSNTTALGGRSNILIKESHSKYSDFMWIMGDDKIATVLPVSDRNEGSSFWSVIISTDTPISSKHLDENDIKELLYKNTKPFMKNYNQFKQYFDNTEQFVVWDIFELDRNKETTKWGHNCVTLLGDAAHAITPWVGQGASISIEDAYDLAFRLTQNQSINSVIQEYEKQRIPRANYIRNRALANKKLMSSLNHPILSKFLPFYFKLLEMDKIFEIVSNPIFGYNSPSESLSTNKRQD